MANDESTSFIAGLVLGGLFGYSLGSGKVANWDEVIKKFNERLSHTKYYKITLPFGFFEKSKNSQVLYREGLNCYLLGLPNASLPLIVRVLEIALKLKYEKVKNEKFPKSWKLVDLIDWAEEFLGKKKELAQGFRILRNVIHEETLIQEQVSLDAIRYISEIINLLYPFDSAHLPTVCPYCRHQGVAIFQIKDCFLGNNIQLQCNCSKIYDFFIMP